MCFPHPGQDVKNGDKRKDRRGEEDGCWSGAALKHKAHLETPACACAPAGRGQGTAPEDTSSHGLSGKHITAHQREATLTSTPVSLFSNVPLHQPADTELWLNFFPIIKMPKVTYDFFFFFCITKQTSNIWQNPLFPHGKFDLKVAPAQGRSSEGG